MTVQEAIGLVDKLKPNQYDQATKARWLKDVDEAIHLDIVLTHAPNTGEADSFDADGYTAGDHVLLVPPPFEDIYLYYLSTQIDLYNAELGKYANDMALYNAAYTNYSSWYTRTHAPKAAIRELRI